MLFTRSLRPATLGLALLLGLPRAAGAQPAPADAVTIDTARRYFEAGLSAMARSDWTEALIAFDSSARVRHSAAVILNQGVCLHRLGRLVEARGRLQEFMETASTQQHQANDPQVGPLLAEIARRVGRIQFAQLAPAGAAVLVDDRAVTLDASRVALVDPGAHTLRGRQEGFAPHEAPRRVAEGATVLLRVALLPASRVAAATDPRVAVAAPRSRPLTEQWWFWTAIGVGVTAATVGIILATSSTDAPVASSTGVTLQAVTGRGGFSW